MSHTKSKESENTQSFYKFQTAEVPFKYSAPQ